MSSHSWKRLSERAEEARRSGDLMAAWNLAERAMAEWKREQSQRPTPDPPIPVHPETYAAAERFFVVTRQKTGQPVIATWLAEASSRSDWPAKRLSPMLGPSGLSVLELRSGSDQVTANTRPMPMTRQPNSTDGQEKHS